MRKFIPKAHQVEQYTEWAKTHWWSVGRYSILPKFVINEVEKIRPDIRKLNLLDIGAGRGEIMKRLSDKFKVFGIDISQKAVEAAKQNNVIIQLGNAKNLPYDRECFDVITAFDLLEHFPQDKKILRHWWSRLKPKGLLFLSVPAYQWLWSVDDIIAGHKRRYSAQDLKEKLEGEGFQIKRMTYFNFFLFPISVIVKLWKRFRLDLERLNDEELFDHFGFHLGYNTFINPLLAKIFSSETFLIRCFSLPFGVSLLVCAEKT